MSLRVYLSKGVKEVDGYKEHKSFNSGKEYTEYLLPGMNLYFDDDKFHINLSRPTDSIPEYLQTLVEEISFYDTIPTHPKRETGVYRLMSAEAEVEVYTAGKTPCYSVRIRAKEMGDIIELFRLIQTGNIRPDESFECEQAGLSGPEIAAELFRVLDEVVVLRHANEHSFAISEGYRQSNDEKEERMRRSLNLIHGLRGERWPCKTARKDIIEKLWDILSPGLMEYFPARRK